MRTKLPALLVAGFLPLLSGCLGVYSGGSYSGLLSPLEFLLVGLVVLAVYTVALIDILRSSRLASEKAIFTILIFFVPVIGLVVYLLLRGKE